MYYFIINPKSSSGRSSRFWQLIKDELDKNNISYSAHFSKEEGHASQLVTDICHSAKGIKNIVVIGGDGTLNEVVNGISDFSQVLLGYIPSGSSNDLARSLDIPKNPMKALEKILKPKKIQYFDLGLMHFLNSDLPSRKFICSSGIGYDASVCVEVQSSTLKGKFNRFGLGKLVYLAITIKQIFTVKPISGYIIVDGVKKTYYDKILLVANMIHPYEGGGVKMAPHAHPRDGKLSILLAQGLSRFKTILLMPTILFGKHTKFKGIEAFNCSTIEIHLDQDAATHTDGEVPAIWSHIKVECLPRQIRMII